MRAFSLIESLVVIGIMVLLLTLGIPAFRGRQQAVNLQSDARTLLSDLRLAQQRTVGEQITYLVKLLTTNPQKYQVVKRSGGDTIIKQHDLSSGVSWQNTGGFTNDEIVFTTTGAVVQSGTIILQNTASQTISVEVKPSGYVRVQ